TIVLRPSRRADDQTAAGVDENADKPIWNLPRRGDSQAAPPGGSRPIDLRHRSGRTAHQALSRRPAAPAELQDVNHGSRRVSRSVRTAGHGGEEGRRLIKDHPDGPLESFTSRITSWLAGARLRDIAHLAQVIRSE